MTKTNCSWEGDSHSTKIQNTTHIHFCESHDDSREKETIYRRKETDDLNDDDESDGGKEKRMKKKILQDKSN